MNQRSIKSRVSSNRCLAIRQLLSTLPGLVLICSFLSVQDLYAYNSCTNIFIKRTLYSKPRKDSLILRGDGLVPLEKVPELDYRDFYIPNDYDNGLQTPIILGKTPLGILVGSTQSEGDTRSDSYLPKFKNEIHLFAPDLASSFAPRRGYLIDLNNIMPKEFRFGYKSISLVQSKGDLVLLKFEHNSGNTDPIYLRFRINFGIKNDIQLSNILILKSDISYSGFMAPSGRLIFALGTDHGLLASTIKEESIQNTNGQPDIFQIPSVSSLGKKHKFDDLRKPIYVTEDIDGSLILNAVDKDEQLVYTRFSLEGNPELQYVSYKTTEPKVLQKPVQKDPPAISTDSNTPSNIFVRIGTSKEMIYAEVLQTNDSSYKILTPTGEELTVSKNEILSALPADFIIKRRIFQIKNQRIYYHGMSYRVLGTLPSQRNPGSIMLVLYNGKWSEFVELSEIENSDDIKIVGW